MFYIIEEVLAESMGKINLSLKHPESALAVFPHHGKMSLTCALSIMGSKSQ